MAVALKLNDWTLVSVAHEDRRELPASELCLISSLPAETPEFTRFSSTPELDEATNLSFKFGSISCAFVRKS